MGPGGRRASIPVHRRPSIALLPKAVAIGIFKASLYHKDVKQQRHQFSLSAWPKDTNQMPAQPRSTVL